MKLSIPLTVLLVAALGAGEDTPDPKTLKDKITLTAGKSLLVQFERKGGDLTKPNVVKKESDAPPTVNFELTRMGNTLLLATKNPFPQPLKFRALARYKGRQEYRETSIQPVLGRLLGIELWKEPIEELVLFDFKLIEKERS